MLLVQEQQELIGQLREHFNTFPLRVAGRLVYYDENLDLCILAVHTTGADKTQQVAEIAWGGLPPSLKSQLKELHTGFAVRQI